MFDSCNLEIAASLPVITGPSFQHNIQLLQDKEESKESELPWCCQITPQRATFASIEIGRSWTAESMKPMELKFNTIHTFQRHVNIGSSFNSGTS